MKMLRLFILAVAGVAIASCSRDSSSSTGWDYNNVQHGGFQKVPFVDQETGPGLILVEGGTFTMVWSNKMLCSIITIVLLV